MKVWNYMAIMLGMIIFLYFLGFDLTSSGGGEILNDTGIYLNNTDMGQSNIDVTGSNWFGKLFDKIDGLIVLLGLGGAIIIGLFGKTLDWKLVLGVPFFSIFGIKFARVGWAVVNLARVSGEDWLVGIVITIFGVLTAMFVFSVFEWFSGGDN